MTEAWEPRGMAAEQQPARKDKALTRRAVEREPFSPERTAPRMPRGSKCRVRGLARAEGGGRGRRVYMAWTGRSVGNMRPKREAWLQTAQEAREHEGGSTLQASSSG